jgi:hypothetical protein
MPVQFKRTEHLKRPADFTATKNTNNGVGRKTGLDAAYVLPGGLNLIASERPQHARSIKKYQYQNQVRVGVV